MTTLFHGSQKQIEEINENGVFGSFLFFSYDEDAAESHGRILYSIEIDDSDIVKASSLFRWDDSEDDCKEIIEQLMNVLDCDKELALDLLSENVSFTDYCNENGIEWDYEVDFMIQKFSADCAKAQGFRGVEVTDEHGTSYMIDMLNHVVELTIVD